MIMVAVLVTSRFLESDQCEFLLCMLFMITMKPELF